MDRSTVVFAACALVSLWACARDQGPVPAAPAFAAVGSADAQAAPPATAASRPSAGASAPIAVPEKDDATIAARQSPIDDAEVATSAAAHAPLPENSDVGYRCEDGGLVRVVYTRAHANLSLDGVFLPLQPWLQESRRTGAEAWEGGHVAMVRRGDVIDLREADGDQRRCKVHADA